MARPFTPLVFRTLFTALLFSLVLFAGCDSGGGNSSNPEPEPDPEPTVPTAAFSADPTEVTVGVEVSFSNTSEDATSYVWDFGDGETSTEESPAHTYEEAGMYTVMLTASNDAGDDTETKTDYITVNPAPMSPEANFEASATEVEVGTEISFTDLSTNEPTGWGWDFGDGTTSAEQNPAHVYDEAGTYTVSLTATNETGSDTETKQDYITVVPPPMPPEADFEADPTTVEVAETVQFTDLSTNEPTSWEWTFGDGETSAEQNPTHTYSEPGTYAVSLTATNEDGSDTETKTGYITVEAQRTYEVEYVVDATFEECSVRYDNESGGTTSRDINFADRSEPFRVSIEVIVGDVFSEFVGVSVSCLDFDNERTASAQLIIDGEVFEEGEETGTSVSINLDARLTLEGPETF